MMSGEIGNRCAEGAICSACGERGGRRTRQDQISLEARKPVKLRTKDPHRTKKTGFFCQIACSRRANSSKARDPAV
jgi:hypothetical protein